MILWVGYPVRLSTEAQKIRRWCVTWALKDRSAVSRSCWEWSPEKDNLLRFQVTLSFLPNMDLS